MSEIRAESKHGEVTLFGTIVSVKVTPDRRVWVRWEGKNGRFFDVGRKVQLGLSRSQKEMWLVQYRQLLLERFHERGYTEKDVHALAAAKREQQAREDAEPERPVRGDDDDEEEADEEADAEADAEEEVDDMPPPPPRPRG